MLYDIYFRDDFKRRGRKGCVYMILMKKEEIKKIVDLVGKKEFDKKYIIVESNWK